MIDPEDLVAGMEPCVRPVVVDSRNTGDDDCNYWEVKAECGGFVGFGASYSRAKATELAKERALAAYQRLSPAQYIAPPESQPPTPGKSS